MKENSTNSLIREAITNAGIKYWEVAKEYGLSDGNFSRKLRSELSEIEKKKILNIISKIVQKKRRHNMEQIEKQKNKLQIFNSNQFGRVRTTLLNNQPYFCLTDVCKILAIKNASDCKKRLNQKGIATTDTLTKGGNQKLIFIDESNLYKCIFQSNKEEAEQFTEWVTSEVLPQIRKHGMYATNELLDNPDLAIQVFTELKQEREKVKLLEEKQEQDKPLVTFAECVSTSDDCISVSKLAKLISNSGFTIGQNRLFEWLRTNKYLMRGNKSKHNLPYQEYIDMRSI